MGRESYGIQGFNNHNEGGKMNVWVIIAIVVSIILAFVLGNDESPAEGFYIVACGWVIIAAIFVVDYILFTLG